MEERGSPEPAGGAAAEIGGGRRKASRGEFFPVRQRERRRGEERREGESREDLIKHFSSVSIHPLFSSGIIPRDAIA